MALPPRPSPQALQQLQQVMARWSAFPGSQPGGNGQTGLQQTDASGWNAMQAENLQAQQTLDALQGKTPQAPTVQYKLGPGAGLPPAVGSPTAIPAGYTSMASYQADPSVAAGLSQANPPTNSVGNPTPPASATGPGDMGQFDYVTGQQPAIAGLMKAGMLPPSQPKLVQ